MHKRQAALLQRYTATFGDVKPSEARAAIEAKTTLPGAPRKWDHQKLWIFYLAIEDRKERGVSVRKACRAIAEGTVQSWKTIEGIYYRACKFFNPLARPSLADFFLREWGASEPPTI
jgi:hypothetical protein